MKSSNSVHHFLPHSVQFLHSDQLAENSCCCCTLLQKQQKMPCKKCWFTKQICATGITVF